MLIRQCLYIPLRILPRLFLLDYTTSESKFPLDRLLIKNLEMTMANMIGVHPANSKSLTCLFLQTMTLNNGIMPNMPTTITVLRIVSICISSSSIHFSLFHFYIPIWCWSKDAHTASNTSVTMSPVEDAMGQAILSGSIFNFLQSTIRAHMNTPKIAAEKEADTIALAVMNIIS